MTTFAVVTATHPGDMAAALDITMQTEQPSALNGWVGVCTPLAQMGDEGLRLALGLRQPVFVLGEILMLGDDGREVNGRGRKPSKWFVTTEEFDTIDEAIQRATSLTPEEY